MKRVAAALLVLSCKGIQGDAAPEDPESTVAPPGVSPEQHNKDVALKDGLAPTCASCHGSGTNKPFFASSRAFADLLVYNTQYVVPGRPDESELVRLLEARGTTYKQMPLGSKSFADMADVAKITLAEVKDFIRHMKPRTPTEATPDLSAPTMRRLSAVQVERALYDQLGLDRNDFFDPESHLARHPDLLPLRNPDQAIPQKENYIASYARTRWVGLGGANHLSLVAPKNDPTPTFAQNIQQIAQGWCRIAVDKPTSAILKHAAATDTSATNAAGIRKNVEYLYTRMLGLAPNTGETDKLVALFAHYETVAGPKLGWTSVCAALVRHPLWLSY